MAEEGPREHLVNRQSLFHIHCDTLFTYQNYPLSIESPGPSQAHFTVENILMKFIPYSPPSCAREINSPVVTPTGKSVPRAPYLKDAEPIKPWGKIATSLLAAISPRNDQDGTSDATGNDDAEPSPSSNFLN